MKIATSLTAASMLVFASSTMAAEELSLSEMDNISAGGFAVADAIATALGNITSSSTATQTSVVSIGTVLGQLGAIHIIQSDALAAAASDSDGQAVAAATAAGQGIGSGLSDTTSTVESYTVSSAAGAPAAYSSASQTTIATSVLIGQPASSSSASSSAAALSN